MATKCYLFILWGSVKYKYFISENYETLSWEKVLKVNPIPFIVFTDEETKIQKKSKWLTQHHSMCVRAGSET